MLGILQLASDIINIVCNWLTITDITLLSFVCMHFRRHIGILTKIKKQLKQSTYTLFIKDIYTIDVYKYMTQNVDTVYNWVYVPLIKYNRLEVIRYIVSTGLRWNNDAIIYAARYGHLNLLKYFHEQGNALSEVIMINAAIYGQLQIIEYLHKHDCYWNENTYSLAASRGHIHVIKYLHKHGCPWNKHVFYTAMYFGYTDIMEYLRINNCPLV